MFNLKQKIMSFELPQLPYAHDAFEAYIDAQTMEIHHGKHHQAYVTNLNNAIAGTDAEGKSLEEIIKEISKYSTAVRNNGGGHFNHSLFWKILSPSPALAPSGELKAKLEAKWGSLDKFKEEFNKAAATRFGSGWAWLIVTASGELEICSTPNQDNPLMDVNTTGQGTPILGLDVWEHAYYLKYQNKRPDYIGAFWNVLDWKAVEENYKAASN
ncbi:Fe-Mn family superoxide dismutase [Mangrovibacterium diazotrophicum]|uniref:Superoxide dismutase n=2 Tax=Mangrovibacterium diazotrophicum TaxID=1261403 RepID=A0A419WAX9_9BACT|nr:Fe-Mn family superoxide dismutase [Mangrovibacterium diazotrophicum]